MRKKIVFFPAVAYACYLVLYHRYIYALVAGFVLVGLSWTMLSMDPYGLFHLSLNKLPEEDLESDPRTEWLNMGYWKVGCDVVVSLKPRQ
jgi:hypothetical protein